MTVSASAPILLAGAGKMGAALLDGWLANGIDGGSIIIQDPAISDDVAVRARANGVRVEQSIPALSSAPSVIVVAVKPQVMDSVFPSLAKLGGAETVVLSIAAGRSIASFAAHLGANTAIVRAMPNTPASIGRGITGAFANAHVTAAQKATCDRLLGAVGEVVWLDDEALMDAVTAVSGSGPAYVFLLAEALTEAGRSAGLDEATAARLARATVSGAGELLRLSELDAATLRQNVTSPGGTTAAALDVLMRKDGGLQELMTAAVTAAKKRGRELGQ